jgi:hypothetical protein
MTIRVSRILFAGIFACQAFGGLAHAADDWEVWPEVNAFVPLNDRSRLYLDAAYAQGGESDVQSLDLAAYLDISLKPILREELRAEDWQRSRYFWARIGYDRIFKTTGDASAEAVRGPRDRLVVREGTAARRGLAGGSRVADLRWISGDYSTRYRFRAEVTREYTVLDHSVVPYFNAEWFYDTRYNDWARTLYQVGSEVTVNNHFRYEVYYARQVDHLPEKQSLNALGINLKWYF